MTKEHCFEWNIKCDMAPKPHIDKDAIPGCMFRDGVYCNTQVMLARHRVERRSNARDNHGLDDSSNDSNPSGND